MIPEAKGIIKLNADPGFRDGLRHLETFSHIWIIFQFHEHANEAWRPLTTPPREDAPGRIGVFASRSPHRPNQLGLSAVKLDHIDLDARGGIEIHVSGIDLLDGTPVFDLKPYVPYVDSIPHAIGGWTDTEIPKYEVSFSDAANQRISSMAEISHSKSVDARTDLKLFITQTLELDPRPTPQKKSFPIHDSKHEGMSFAFRVGNFDVHWIIQNLGILVQKIDILN